MMTDFVYWKCDGCGETLQGIMDGQDFISDKELDEQPNADLRAVGCYLCGCPGGEVIEDDRPDSD